MKKIYTADEYRAAFNASQPARRSKFNNTPTRVDGINFPSIKEAKYFGELKLRRAAGDIDFFLMQTPFHLSGLPPVKYLLDFFEFKRQPGGLYSIQLIDVKGRRTRTYINKMKQVSDIYGLEIIEK